jgi:transposase
MKAYSVDLREKVLRAVDQGYPRAEMGKLLGVSRATMKRYVKQRRETGSVAPKAIAGRTPKKLGLLQTDLAAQLQAHDDLRIEDQCRVFEQTHGMHVSTSTMSEAIKRIGWTRQKKRWVPTSRREQERVGWREQMKQVDASRLVIVDECGSHIALTPLYGWAPTGQRAHGSVPRESSGNIRRCSLPCPSQGSEPA